MNSYVKRRVVALTRIPLQICWFFSFACFVSVSHEGDDQILTQRKANIKMLLCGFLQYRIDLFNPQPPFLKNSIILKVTSGMGTVHFAHWSILFNILTRNYRIYFMFTRDNFDQFNGDSTT